VLVVVAVAAVNENEVAHLEDRTGSRRYLSIDCLPFMHTMRTMFRNATPYIPYPTHTNQRRRKQCLTPQKPNGMKKRVEIK
jgi:predicted P-loop ATPase